MKVANVIYFGVQAMVRLSAALSFAAALFAFCHHADAAPSETVIASFTGKLKGSYPGGGLVSDASGVLYGTLQFGGFLRHNQTYGGGVVYSLKPLNAGKTDWQFTVIYRFGAVLHDGFYPWGSLIIGSNGNLYGTTAFGGHCSLFRDGCGTVFALAPPSPGMHSWTETTLYAFTGKADGVEPLAGLVSDSAGNLYGTTSQGGRANNGTIFELSPPTGDQTTWTKETLFEFNDPSYGVGPDSPLLLDGTGALYGTAPAGGGPDGGVVFRISPRGHAKWAADILYTFNGDPGASRPEGGVIAGPNHVLYGTTYAHGSCQTYEFGCGQVFSLTPSANGKSWSETTLYSFQAGTSGSFPTGRLIQDAAGVLYGTTSAADDFYGNDTSTVFSLAPPAAGSTDWVFTNLHEFTATGDGMFPGAGLAVDPAGNLYGTTPVGGAEQEGTAFMVTGSGFLATESSVSTRGK